MKKGGEMQTEKHWCVNRSSIPNHDQVKEAEFYCLLCKVYICEKCKQEHSMHLEQVDFIKNHLSCKYNSWQSLKLQTQNQTVQMIEELEMLSSKKLK